ncbi:histone-lysine N-methyltransferase SETMAR [Trichonephila clavipes]|uniref:Histone-lysine N-methyltransferase SETMAR n=1 Tax=Trichonephila clavipes TaxID=2585209 RepID=A0A8X6VI22_TRICX|nr:histone-lysine N-methyltransferase SETMAR [Trichonephila clavipes]
MVHERRFDWIIVCMSKMWNKYGIERKNGWFSKFCSGELSPQEIDRSGRPSKIDNDVLRFMLENNPHLTSQEIAEEFGIYHTIVGDHIKSSGFVLK